MATIRERSNIRASRRANRDVNLMRRTVCGDDDDNKINEYVTRRSNVIRER